MVAESQFIELRESLLLGDIEGDVGGNLLEDILLFEYGAMVGPESLTVEHLRLEEVLDDKCDGCGLLDFDFEIKPLEMRLGVGVRPDVEVVHTILEHHVLQVPTLEIGVEGDVAVEAMCPLLQLHYSLMSLAHKLLREVVLQLAIEVLFLHEPCHWPEPDPVIMRLGSVLLEVYQWSVGVVL